MFLFRLNLNDLKLRLLVLFLLPFSVFAQVRTVVSGKILDTNKKPVEMATVAIAGTNYATYTDEAGAFHFNIDAKAYPELTLRVSMVGKQGASKTIKKGDYNQEQTFVLEDLSLKLKEVTVSARQKGSDISNSAIVFDRQALDQIQAYSLADVLNNLPGKITGAPNLQSAQVATLRNPAAGSDPVQQRVNSMGIAIYIDGVRVSNDANMQSKGIGVNGISSAVIDNQKNQPTGGSTYDTPYSGLDLRNFPVDNIERVEVVSGVSSAKYGEMTDGAIFITTKTGKTPYSASVRLNGASTNLSLLKGFSLGRKGGDINANINYLNSIQDPTNNLKSYGRFTGGLKWSNKIGKHLTNSLSTDFSYKIDNAKIDPDDLYEETTYSKERRISFTDRLILKSESKWFTGASVNVKYDVGYQETYRQKYRNGATLAVADKDTTGIYEGYFAPGNYYATEHVVGRPYNFSSGLDINNVARTGLISHQISYGATVFTSGNNGQGLLADPNRPPTNSSPKDQYRSDRPYDFELQRPLLNFGFYAEDLVKLSVFKHEMSVNAGLRYDIQNGFPNWQPRVNASYKLNKRWSLQAAYGISTKSPSMAYRYPAPTYYDIPLFLQGNGNANQSTYLVYTRKIDHDNSSLKPSRSSQLELGVTADYKFFNTSLFGYYKQDRDGISDYSKFLPIYLPEYVNTAPIGQKPIPTPTGKTILYAGLKDNVVGNNVQSDNYGLEWYLSTRKIKAIETSFTFSTSVAYSKYNNRGQDIEAPATGVEPSAVAWYGVYQGRQSTALSIISKLSIDTHIPDLGFVVTLSTDVNWRNVSTYDVKSIYPVAYIDNKGNTIPIQNFDAQNPVYGNLIRKAEAGSFLADPPFVYANMNLRIAKEIKKTIRVALFAYNFLDNKIQYVNPLTQIISVYNSPVNVGAEVSFKF